MRSLARRSPRFTRFQSSCDSSREILWSIWLILRIYWLVESILIAPSFSFSAPLVFFFFLGFRFLLFVLFFFSHFALFKPSV